MMDNELELQTLIEQLKQSSSEDVQAIIDEIILLLGGFLLGEELSERGIKQLGKQMASLYQSSKNIFDKANSALLQSGRETVELVGTVTKNQINAPSLAVPSTKVERYLSTPTPSFSGSAIDDVLSGFSQNQSKRIIDAIRLAQSQGKTNAQIMQILRGTKKHNYQDGLISASKRQADAITRTVVQDIAMQAKVEMFLKNPEIFGRKIKIVAVLDKRTSAKCRSLDGRIFDIKDNIRPPFHVRCRSSFISVKGGDPPKRASQDGVVENMTYYEWLKTKTAEFQDGVLGKTRGELFRSGKLSAEQFSRLQLDKNFRPLTLKQLQQNYPDLFGANK